MHSPTTRPLLPLLAADEPPAFEVVNPEGRARAVLICDHASPRVPRALHELGLPEKDRLAHIGWDVGAADVARRLSALIDAPLVLSGYSRLVIDCNREPGTEGSIPPESGGARVPGNEAVSEADARARADVLFWPYHRAIDALLDARASAGRATALLCVHSFTPVEDGERRPWDAGIIYGREDRMSQLVLEALRAEPSLVVGDNQPYSVESGGDYSVPTHGEQRGIPHASIEMRQDGLTSPEGVEAWAQRLARVLAAIEPRLASG